MSSTAGLLVWTASCKTTGALQTLSIALLSDVRKDIRWEGSNALGATKYLPGS